jgi:hypothetical protein
VAVLTVIVGAVVALEASAPEVEVADRRVHGVPPLALDAERSCTRQGGGGVAQEIRTDFPEAGRVSSTQVFLCPRAFDGLTVTYVGEVIGEVLPRRGGAWAQVNDDIYALEVGPLVGHREQDGFNTGLSVWLPDGLHQQVEEVGRPGRRGDVILIRGTLERTDPQDGGGTTVRATSLEVLAPSIEVEDPLHVPQLVAAIVLSMLAIASVMWSRRTSRRA